MELLDPFNPFSAPFKITNVGNLSIYTGQAECAVVHTQTASNVDISNTGGPAQSSAIDELETGQSTTVACPVLAGRNSRGAINLATDRLLAAKLSVDITFRPSFWFRRIHHRSTFRTVTTSTGQLRWVPDDAHS